MVWRLSLPKFIRIAISRLKIYHKCRKRAPGSRVCIGSLHISQGLEGLVSLTVHTNLGKFPSLKCVGSPIMSTMSDSPLSPARYHDFIGGLHEIKLASKEHSGLETQGIHLRDRC